MYSEPDDNELTVAFVIRLRVIYDQVLQSMGFFELEEYRKRKTKELN